MVVEGSVDSPGAGLRDVYCGSHNEFIVKKLRPFSTYAFRVQAKNAAGTSKFSAFSTCMTSAAAPEPPAPPALVEANSSSITLNWNIPELDNGSPVFRYILELLKVEISTRSLGSVDGGKKTGTKKSSKPVRVTSRAWVVVHDGPELRSQVSDLAPGIQYSFRVKARNALGTSAPSSTLVASTLAAVPCAPLPPTFGRFTPTSVQIKWQSPERDNGMPVTSYKLMLDDGQRGPFQKVYEGEVRSFHASKLVPLSSYRATVQAINAVGASAMSGEAVVELPAEVPVAPPIAPASSSNVRDDWPRTATRHASPVQATIAAVEAVARKPTKAPPAAPPAVEAKAKMKVRAVPATTQQRAVPETIKSIKEVKELMRLKRQGWPQKLARALVQSCWKVQQEWRLLALLLFVIGGFYFFAKHCTKN